MLLSLHSFWYFFDPCFRLLYIVPQVTETLITFFFFRHFALWASLLIIIYKIYISMSLSLLVLFFSTVFTSFNIIQCICHSPHCIFQLYNFYLGLFFHFVSLCSYFPSMSIYLLKSQSSNFTSILFLSIYSSSPFLLVISHIFLFLYIYYIFYYKLNILNFMLLSSGFVFFLRKY